MLPTMTAKLDDLLSEILRLPLWERQLLLDRLQAAEPLGVRDGQATYQSDSMRFVTVALPDDLAKRAQEAGLLGNKTLEGILRRALEAHAESDEPGTVHRRLVEKNGYLVAEALPGERSITSTEVRDILDDMEW
ncbi:MAG TPA: hypothetical protein VGD45_03695 [Steroidobacter sp.]|uniref:hypothetical protein n=1 Tax=Steroidobacter sp. TaxID=1978227 RepID=UPI002EDB9F47